MKSKLVKFVSLGIALPLVVLTSAWFFYISSGSPVEALVEIAPGAGFNKVAATLKEKGVVGDTRLFKLYAASRGDLNNLKPGEYLFKAGASKKSILDAIVRGEIRMYKITIPEGSNIYQIADIYSEELKIDKTEFLKTVKDPGLLHEWNIEGQSLEGYLYPETYYFSKGVKASQVVDKMLKTFQAKYTDEITVRGKKLGLDKRQIVIFASVIEKETGLAEERPLISAVFHNRLKRGMKLQSDPTTIYGIFERYRGNLTKRDLLEETPYNTYRIKGLPAGPIANPGMASLKAAVDPSNVTYLYFVSRNDKSHVFSNNLKEHNANVNKYQLRR